MFKAEPTPEAKTEPTPDSKTKAPIDINAESENDTRLLLKTGIQSSLNLRP